jgi:predicted methyltransferase
MKKVVLTAAIILGGLSTYGTQAQSTNPAEANVIAVQEEFKEVKTEELPQAVKDAFAADFQTATLDKAYVNAKQEYKLVITVDGAASTVYADKDGNWIEKK